MPYKCELCQKTFRYKVSQRTHRCPNEDGQTPEQLIKAFLEGDDSPTQPSPESAEIAAINNGLMPDPEQEALLSQSIGSQKEGQASEGQARPSAPATRSPISSRQL